MRWRDVFIPRDQTFGRLLTEQADIARRGVHMLRRYAQTRDGDLPAQMTTLEAEGDGLRRRLAEAMYETYATPLDREDLHDLSRLLDDVLDAAQEALLTMAIFEVEPTAHLDEITGATAEATDSLELAVRQLTAAPTEASQAARRTKRLENSVGNLFRYGLQRAYAVLAPTDALRVREVYGTLRHVSEAVARAADLIADILVKEK